MPLTSPLNPGAWRPGRSGCVVSDQPTPNGHPSYDDVDYYGGHLICESIQSVADQHMLAAAKDAHDACAAFLRLLDESGELSAPVGVMLKLMEVRDLCRTAVGKSQAWRLHQVSDRPALTDGSRNTKGAPR